MVRAQHPLRLREQPLKGCGGAGCIPRLPSATCNAGPGVERIGVVGPQHPLLVCEE
ncbi:hypothetical protein STAFG_0731 [Streptomyces afghaniensis 772]|uniref:Uncharacterized protein n=1 Tax=Streptomyces afghaniensis 772 TaxID=1283301 RepID=S4NUP5_9ACTN|nr:hypothetical protein STAFG_0731 [Streptomyces afghaniensis 772]